MSEDYVWTKIEQIEAICGEIRTHILGKDKQPPAKPIETFDMTQILWRQMKPTEKGLWDLANDRDNGLNADYVKMKKMVQDIGGNLSTKEWKLWLLPDGTAVGRRKKVK